MPPVVRSGAAPIAGKTHSRRSKVFDSEPDGDVDLTDFVAFRGAFAGS